MDNDRIYLAIGNSRLHWAWFKNNDLIETWNTQHLSNLVAEDKLPLAELSNKLIEQKLTKLPIFIASVVSQQTKLWQNYNEKQIITLQDIKLQNIYPTIGIDRVLAAWGGGETYGYPCLIIDGGTALTFTGIDPQKKLIGGAILPGLRSQLTTLKQKTAALPQIELPTTLPPRWALNTDKAIASGIIYTIIAGIYSYITDWQQQYPNSQVIFTGGDGEILSKYIQPQYPKLKFVIKCDRNLIFYGMKLATAKC